MYLCGELASRGDDDCGYVVSLRGVVEAEEFMDNGEEEGQCLAAAGDGLEFVSMGISNI